MTPEFVGWRKSSRSGGESNCVEVGKWRKSSRSGNQSECVEVGSGALIGVRDTKDRDGGLLAVSASAWTAFVAAVRVNSPLQRVATSSQQ